MSPQLLFWIFFLVLVLLVVYFDIKYNMLKDVSTASKKPYSFSRVQLAWWSVIILASFMTIIAKRGIPDLDGSTLIILGISAITTGSARIIDISDQKNDVRMIQNQDRENFILDVLSDSNGVSIHRFQSLVFNTTFGIWFISQVLHNLPVNPVNEIIPVLSQNNLILLGLSSGAYVALKTTENKDKVSAETKDQSVVVQDEAVNSSANAEG
jgi:hypothetical protein